MNNKPILFLFAAFVLLQIGGKAQSTWNQLYSSNYQMLNMHINATADSGLIIASVAKSSHRSLVVTKIDAEGSIEWNSVWKNPEINGLVVAEDVLIMPDGGSVIACTGSEDDTYYSVCKGLLVRLDPNGDTLWTTTVGTRYSSTIVRDIFHCANGDFLVSGSNTYNAGISSKAYLARIDSTGQFLWANVYNLNEKGRFWRGIETSTGDIVLFSEITAPSVKSLVWKMDANGNVLWRKEYDELRVARMGDLIEGNDGNYILCGAGHAGDYVFDMTVFAVDPNGNLVWHKVYERDYDFSLESVGIRKDDGNGYFVTHRAAGYYGHPEGDVGAIHMDSVGNVLDARRFVPQNNPGYEPLAFDFARGPQGALFMVGTFCGLSLNCPWFVFKTDPQMRIWCSDTAFVPTTHDAIPSWVNGDPVDVIPWGTRWRYPLVRDTLSVTLTPLCTAVGEPEPVIPEALAMTVFPNPGNGLIHFQVEGSRGKGEIRIFALDGREVTRFALNRQKTSWSADVKAGTYLAMYFQEGSPLLTRRLVVLD